MLLHIKIFPNYKLSLVLTSLIVMFGFSLCNAQGGVKRVSSISNTQGGVQKVSSVSNTEGGVQRVGMEPDEYFEFEAENFDKQTETSKRSWHLVTKDKTPKVRKDPDEVHLEGASKSSYLELLPDTLYNGNEKKVDGKNYSKTPGALAVLTYNVNFKTAGRFYVWVRGLSTGDEDNSLHVGIDGYWPDSGQKLYICEGNRNKLSWTSHQFNKSERCGSSERIFIEVKKPGPHKIMFSMREDGFEFDKFALTKKFTKQPM